MSELIGVALSGKFITAFLFFLFLVRGPPPLTVFLLLRFDKEEMEDHVAQSSMYVNGYLEPSIGRCTGRSALRYRTIDGGVRKWCKFLFLALLYNRIARTEGRDGMVAQRLRKVSMVRGLQAQETLKKNRMLLTLATWIKAIVASRMDTQMDGRPTGHPVPKQTRSRR